MLRKLTRSENLEIHELLLFKTASLKKSKLFLEAVKGNILVGLLEKDIKQSALEITDLQDLLLYSNK